MITWHYFAQNFHLDSHFRKNPKSHLLLPSSDPQNTLTYRPLPFTLHFCFRKRFLSVDGLHQTVMNFTCVLRRPIVKGFLIQRTNKVKPLDITLYLIIMHFPSFLCRHFEYVFRFEDKTMDEVFE
jgi:hypothetical protein